jgi:hypothetical protein
LLWLKKKIFQVKFALLAIDYLSGEKNGSWFGMTLNTALTHVDHLEASINKADF